MDISIQVNDSWQEPFLKRLEEDGPWSNWQLYKLAIQAEQHLLVPDFEGLVAPKFLPQLKPLPHQVEAASEVLERMNGKAILADEVGLGKTIEAGLILKEYMIRGLVKKVLILVPASLVSQWVYELNTKFHIPAIAFRKGYNWETVDVCVSSLDLAKKSPHREKILEQNYDFIIIDEAHKLKNHKTKNYEFVQSLKKKFCLLITATPIQNKIEEIFNLVSLLKPGHLGTYEDFLEKYKNSNGHYSDEHLKKLINKVMIRNRRQDIKLEWTKRIVENIWIEFSQEEREFYELLSSFQNGHSPIISNSFSLLTLKREACSSKEAVFFTIKNMYEKMENPSPLFEDFVRTIVEKMNAITINSKANKALELIQQINDKVIIFTEYRATQLYLQWFLKQHGISSVPFRGGFKRGKKDWMKELFQNHAQVFIATEAGGEGINLQFCHHMINFDLPWNPMRLEQRIGRVHRLGQENDVKIYNFAIKNTIEEHILKLLYEKIDLFERVIGELDDILTRLEFGKLEDHLMDIFSHSQSEGEMRIKMENLSSMIEFAQQVKEGEYSEAAGNSLLS